MNQINNTIGRYLNHLPQPFSILGRFYHASPAVFCVAVLVLVLTGWFTLLRPSARPPIAPGVQGQGTMPQRNWAGWSRWNTGNPYSFVSIEVGSLSANWTTVVDPNNMGISAPEYDLMWRPAGPLRDT